MSASIAAAVTLTMTIIAIKMEIMKRLACRITMSDLSVESSVVGMISPIVTIMPPQHEIDYLANIVYRV